MVQMPLGMWESLAAIVAMAEVRDGLKITVSARVSYLVLALTDEARRRRKMPQKLGGENQANKSPSPAAIVVAQVMVEDLG